MGINDERREYKFRIQQSKCIPYCIIYNAKLHYNCISWNLILHYELYNS